MRIRRSAPLSRRTFLRGTAGVTLGLPLLDAMITRSAQAQDELPRRIIFEFKANGDETRRRFVGEGERDFVFDEFLEPLEPYRDDLLILNRLDKRYFDLPQNERADNHQQGGMALAPWPALSEQGLPPTDDAGAARVGRAAREPGAMACASSCSWRIPDRCPAAPSAAARRISRSGRKSSNRSCSTPGGLRVDAFARLRCRPRWRAETSGIAPPRWG